MNASAFSLTEFSQARLLAGERDPAVRGGVCVALCDYWLRAIRGAPAIPVRQRLQALEANFAAIVEHQRQYGRLRREQGREQARRQMGSGLGIDYEEQTLVQRSAVGIHGMKAKMKSDIGAPGRAATWTMRFAPDANGISAGHAIAGFCGIERLPYGLRYRMHVFDPNIGEYVGELGQLDAMLDDLLARFPMYALVADLHRTHAGA